MLHFSFIHPFFRGLDSVRRPVHVNDVSLEGKAVYNGRSNDLIGEDLIPFVEAKVGSNDDGFDAGTEGYEVEKGLCALFIKGFVPALIQDREVVFLKAFLQPGEFSL